jgi:50S ribosomal protein L16 3-hydroxylase
MARTAAGRHGCEKPFPAPAASAIRRGVLGSLTPEQFIERHWQRAPLLVRGAIPGLKSPITPEELAGLACEPGVEARLVQGRVGGSWSLEHGPFEPSHFEALPERDWTVLVQDVDKVVPELARLLDEYRWLPDWRVDDVMVSYAAPGGSVGPHTDQYDVFLIQALGRRRWQIAEHFDPALVPDADLRLLARFTPEQEFICEPGDILYLPPHVAHYGLALDAALTFSIGFRAPDQRELIGALWEDLRERAGALRFEDPGRPVAQDPSVLAEPDLARFRELIRSGLTWSDADLDGLVGRYLTRPKPHLEPEEQSGTAKQLERRLLRGERLVRRLGARLARVERGEELWLFADGRQFRLARAQAAWVTALTSGQALGAEFVREQPAALSCILGLFRQGTLEWQENADEARDPAFARADRSRH